MDSQAWLRSRLSAFYRGFFVDSVPSINSREFGIGEFGRKISNRHLSFSSAKELNFFLREKSPFYISYSNAFYEFPSARPMEKKSLTGADLIYEFDADDLKTECKLSHDSWKCVSCGVSGKGNIEKCPECGSGVKVDEWVCPECIGETKKQTKKLLRVLETDFGFSDGISVNFSGGKGFHVHVRSEKVHSLSKSARLELLDYLTLSNLDLASLGFVQEKKGVFACPSYSKARGLSKRLLDFIINAIDSDDAPRIAVLGSSTVLAAKKLLKEKQALKSGIERGFLLAPKGVKEGFWNSFLSFAIDAEKFGVDRQTSIDINKIIRVPETIHGSTGLLAKEVPLEELSGFDALKESVVMGPATIGLSNVSSPRFYVNGEWFGPFEKAATELPEYAAFFVLARGAGFLRGN